VGDEDCREALETKPAPGFFSRMATGAKDYWRHQKNLQFAVNHVDRDLFTTLVNAGVVTTGSIRRGENVVPAAPLVRELPMFDVNGREHVRVRVRGRNGTITAVTEQDSGLATVEAEVITGGRTYGVRLAADNPRVREFLATQHLTIATGLSLGAGPYRESTHNTAMPSASASYAGSLASSESIFGETIMRIAREKGIAQQVLDRVDPRSLSLVGIQAGSFDMGSPTDEADRDARDETLHRVHLSQNFEMQATPMTQFAWFVVMGTSPSYFRGNTYAENDYASVGNTQMLLNYPVEQVSYEDVKGFLKKLNELMQRYNRGIEGEYALPTEAQWEYAARAGTTSRYHFDESRDSLGDVAWYSENAGGHTHAVGTRQANPWGLFDMGGNVWQWVKDWYVGAYPTGDVTDPSGPSSGSSRVLRGGGWASYAGYVRSAQRNLVHPGLRYLALGFRVVRFVRTLP
jgi:formylglycine-generating enzyme required for sulfatase activity